MTVTLGQSVIVENRPGATGNIGADYVAKSRPDGHTLVIASLSNIINQATGNATANLINDFTPVCFSGGVLYAMLVPNELPAKNVAELVELARKEPGKLNFSGFVGGVPQFLGEMLNRAAKINTVMVPYKSTTDALPDLLTNRIQMWFTPVASGGAGLQRQAGPHARRHRREADGACCRTSRRSRSWATPTSWPTLRSTCWRRRERRSRSAAAKPLILLALAIRGVSL